MGHCSAYPSVVPLLGAWPVIVHEGWFSDCPAKGYTHISKSFAIAAWAVLDADQELPGHEFKSHRSVCDAAAATRRESEREITEG